jgi:hypothetical protein
MKRMNADYALRSKSSGSSARILSAFTWTGLIVIVASGCNRQSAGTTDALPWNKTSTGAPTEVAAAPSTASDKPKRSIDPRETEFRDRIVQQHLAALQRIAADPIVVDAVLKANVANQQTQEEINQTDVQWRETQGVDSPLVSQCLNNACAKMLKQVQKAHPEYLELFVMDDKGCNVAQSNKTSDYWQGDEAKWIESFNRGHGKVFVDDIQYDESTRAYVVQISLPVFDKQGATIGAITISIASQQHI